MSYTVRDYGSSRTDLIQALRNAFEEAGFTIAAHEGENLCVKLKDDLYVGYRCIHSNYVSRGGSYSNAMYWVMGTSHSGTTVTGVKCAELSHGMGNRNFSGPRQHCPVPGKLHFCKTDVAGKTDYIFCLENPADNKGASHVGVELLSSDPQFGAHSHFYLAGPYARHGGTEATNPGPFQTVNDYNSGFIRRQAADGTLLNYETAGYGSSSTGAPHNTINSYMSTGYEGYYQSIENDLYFAPSLTTVMLPMLWGCVMPKTSSDARFGAPPKGEFPQVKLSTMKYSGIGTQITLDGKTYRMFPRIGKGGTAVTAFAFRES